MSIMRLDIRLFAFCLAIATAGAENDFIMTTPSMLPECASCVLNELSSITSCSNVTLRASLAACIRGQCNYTDQSRAAVAINELCSGSPVESHVLDVAVITLVFGPLAVMGVILRCYSRYSSDRRLASDDWVIVAAAMLLIPLIALTSYNALHNGFGRHIWDVDPIRAVEMSKIFYIGEIIYTAIITLVKSSILLFYLRVFPGDWFRIADVVILGSSVAFSVAVCLATAFQCTPIAGAWDKTILSQCIDVHALIYAASGIFVAQDIIVLVLPLPALYSLRMDMRKKLNVMFMFSIGIVACIMSIVRLKYLVDFGKTTDQSWDNSFTVMWSLLEISIATICACLPALRSLLSTRFPSVFDNKSTYRSDKTDFDVTDSYTLFPRTPRKVPQKVGPSYNKRIITSPDDDILMPTPKFETFSQRAKLKDKDIKVWINPKFDARGTLLDFEYVGPDSDMLNIAKMEFRDSGPSSNGTSLWGVNNLHPTLSSPQKSPSFHIQRPDSEILDIERRNSEPSSETSVWALEGPRESDEMTEVEVEAEGEEGVVLQAIGVALGSPSKVQRVSPKLTRLWKKRALPLLPTMADRKSWL